MGNGFTARSTSFWYVFTFIHIFNFKLVIIKGRVRKCVTIVFAEKWKIIWVNLSFTFLQIIFNLFIFHWPDIIINRSSIIGIYQVETCIIITNINISIKGIIVLRCFNQIIMLSLLIFKSQYPFGCLFGLQTMKHGISLIIRGSFVVIEDISCSMFKICPL